MPGGKEWLIGAPEFKDQMYSLDELKGLIKEKRVLGTDLVLKEGGVWRSAKDYPELSALFTDEAPSTRLGPKIVIEPPRPQAPPRQARIMSSTGAPPSPPAPPPPPPPPKVTRKTAIIEPAKNPMRKTQVIVPGPAPVAKGPKTEKLVKPPDFPKSPTEKIVIKPPEEPPKPPPTDRIERSKAETAVDAAAAAPVYRPVSETEETKSDEGNLEKAETKTDAPAKIKPRPQRRPLPPPEPVIVALEVSEFTEADLQRGMWKALHWLNLFVAFLMAFACLFLGTLFNVTEASYLVSTFLFFAMVAIAHGAQAFATRCSIEKKGSVSLIVTYLKQSFSLLVSLVLALLLLFPPTLGLSVVRQADVQWASFIVLIVVMMTFSVFALIYVMTAGYWNAILAVEVCGPGKAASNLFRAYRQAFRLVLGHSALALLLAVGAFGIITLPTLGAVMMNFGKSAAVPIDSLLLAMNFGLGAGVGLSVLAVANVLSYIYIRKYRFVDAPPAPAPEPKKDEVPVEGGSGAEPKHADTTQIELEPAKDPTKPEEKPPELPPAAS